ncbi:flavin reductase family protein [Savagea sp. SN6]|uniref:Flavin reductase family protein n=1 Tax=Savagea serpentis TaxID=2785297 RepID=A0A8J7G640_9BACL|nr:flavin reductase family protein [Savagea serpentis]MBF4501001.1 flavin reductase family protein [Savagea serpentis]
MDVREFRNCMGRFATGVTVVTCKKEDGYHGFTANSFTSVSLNPPLILVSVDKKTKAAEYLRNNSFAVNILQEDQHAVAMHFAGRPNEDQLFDWHESLHTVKLDRALAHIECTPWAEYDGGDHVLFLGEVQDFTYTTAPALTYYAGQFSKLEHAE